MPSLSRRRNPLVLLVEDDVGLREAVVRGLTKAGYLVATAAGTLWNFPEQYARGTGQSLRTVFGSMWLRALLGVTISSGTALAVLRFGSSWPMAIVAGGCGTAMALLWAVGWARWRSGNRDESLSIASLAEYL